MKAGLDGLPAGELRALIREVLRDVLPALAEREPVQASSVAATQLSQPPATPPLGVPAGYPAAPQGVPAAAVPPAVAAQARMPDTAPQRPGATRQVRLATDEDVRQFALEVVRLADNPARRRDLMSGRLRFTLAGRDDQAAAHAEHRIETGAVTERSVQAAAKAGQRLVLGPRAVLTPLARDRALALGVPIERER